MKKLFTLIFLACSLSIFAQPVNDDCVGLIDLGVVPYCSDSIGVFYTNLDATESDIGNDNLPGAGACGDNDITFVGNDVWFAFTTSDTILDYTITVTGITDGMGSVPMSNPQIMIYRGACACDEMALLACGAANDGENVLPLDVLGLDPNEVYFLRINDFSSTATPNWGTFQLCIDELQPPTTIDGGGSTFCTGELFDTGGPDGDYGNNENNIFTICPPFGNNACITFDLEYYNVENTSDQIFFYDGPDISSPLITAINGAPGGTPNEGGVAYTVQASNGCLTIQMITDATVTNEGFAGSWQCSSEPCPPTTSITVNSSITHQEIIDNIGTPQTLITIDTIKCGAGGAYGTFQAGDFTDLGLSKGLLLTTGTVNNALGPNNSPSISEFIGTLGDADLDYLSSLGGGQPSQDACVVELDVFVATDELTFEYIFGSEEYQEFVNSGFNDIFALLISGPGIAGDPNMSNQENMALIPGTTNPVEINSVNHGSNWQYYRDNLGGLSVEYDGLTSDYLGIKKSLTASRQVIPCNTYHLKFAIADRGDSGWDSGVFISEIKGGTPSIAGDFASGVTYFVEECTGDLDEIVITLSNALDDSISYNVNILGTATQGVDYTLNIPDVIWFAPGQTELSYSIIPLADGIPEDVETITIIITKDFGCGEILLDEITFEISDYPLIEILTGQDTAFVCQDNCFDLSVTGGTSYFWTPVSVVDDPFSPVPVACPTSDGWLHVTGSIGALPGCTAEDSIFLKIIDPQMEIVPLDEFNICVGDSVHLQAVNNVNNQGLVWSPGTGLSNINDEFVTASPSGNITYTATVTLQGCSASDNFTVNVDAFDFPDITTLDTAICQGQSVLLAEQIPNSTTVYEWLPNQFLEPSNTVSGPLATPMNNITYTFVATSQNGFCSETASVDIEVIPAEVNVLPADIAYICIGESTDLSATTTTGMVNWSPAGGLSSTTDLNVTANPVVSTMYYASMTIGACTVTDSVFVRVDSLPSMSILALPPDQPYCPGDTILLYSTVYEPNHFPDIEHQWTPPDALTPLDLYNLVFIANESLTYYRNVTNNACSGVDSIYIDVFPPPPIEVSPDDLVICVGESVQLNASSSEINEFTWSPEDGTLSCIECPDPVATPSSTTTYTVQGGLEECPSVETIEIEVVPNSVAAVIEDSTICIGNSIVLNMLEDPYPGTTWSWEANPPDPSLNPNDPLAEVTPSVSTTYTLTVSNGACDPLVQSTTVNVVQNAVLNFTQDLTICEGQSAILTAVSTQPGDFVWSTGEASETVGTSDEIIVAPTVESTYSVIFTSESGCDTLTESVFVDVIPRFDVFITAEPDPAGPDSIPEGTIMTLTATTDVPVPGAIYTWSTGQTGQTIMAPANLNPSVFSVTVTSAEGCFYSDELSFEIEVAVIAIPNVFTPNGDDSNDYFNVYSNNEDIVITEFKVFNRWGQLVYNNDDPANGWDGTYKNEPAPSDAYIYVISVQFPSGTVQNAKGDVTLLR